MDRKRRDELNLAIGKNFVQRRLGGQPFQKADEMTSCFGEIGQEMTGKFEFKSRKNWRKERVFPSSDRGLSGDTTAQEFPLVCPVRQADQLLFLPSDDEATRRLAGNAGDI